MGPSMAREFPEVQSFVRFTQSGVLVRKDNASFYEEDCFLADSSIFDVFTFDVLKGDPKTALREP